MSNADLFGLLHESRAKNEVLGVTGILLYKSGVYFTILRGRGGGGERPSELMGATIM